MRNSTWRRGCLEVNACKRFLVRNLQKHHSGRRDAVALPVADAGHARIEEASDCGCTAERVNYLGCMSIHAHMLEQANY